MKIEPSDQPAKYCSGGMLLTVLKTLPRNELELYTVLLHHTLKAMLERVLPMGITAEKLQGPPDATIAPAEWDIASATSQLVMEKLNKLQQESN